MRKKYLIFLLLFSILSSLFVNIDLPNVYAKVDEWEPRFYSSKETDIPFETEYKENPDLPKGEEKLIQKGVNGKKVTDIYYCIRPQSDVIPVDPVVESFSNSSNNSELDEFLSPPALNIESEESDIPLSLANNNSNGGDLRQDELICRYDDEDPDRYPKYIPDDSDPPIPKYYELIDKKIVEKIAVDPIKEIIEYGTKENPNNNEEDLYATKEVEIPFETERRPNLDMEEGQEKTIQTGVVGKKVIKSYCHYEKIGDVIGVASKDDSAYYSDSFDLMAIKQDPPAVDDPCPEKIGFNVQKELTEEVVTPPINEIIEYGTKPIKKIWMTWEKSKCAPDFTWQNGYAGMQELEFIKGEAGVKIVVTVTPNDNSGEQVYQGYYKETKDDGFLLERGRHREKYWVIKFKEPLQAGRIHIDIRKDCNPPTPPNTDDLEGYTLYSTKEEDLPFGTEYRMNIDMLDGEEKVIQEGVLGKKLIKTYYRYEENPNPTYIPDDSDPVPPEGFVITGKKVVKEIVLEPERKIVERGILIDEKGAEKYNLYASQEHDIPFETTRKPNPDLLEGKEKIIQDGVVGKRVINFYYNEKEPDAVDPEIPAPPAPPTSEKDSKNKGDKTKNIYIAPDSIPFPPVKSGFIIADIKAVKKTITEPVTKIVEYGTKIVYTYKGDPDMEPGTERKVDGEKTIYVGIKPKRETVTIPHEVLDPKEGFEIIPGKDGSKDVVTTYEVNPETGKVTSSTHEENLVPQVDDKYKPIDYTYKGDPNMEPGTERKVDGEKTIYVGIKPKRETVTIPHKVLDPKEGFEIIPGKDGSKDVVTTYEVNPETGKVTSSTHEENLVPQVDDKYKPIDYTYKPDPNMEPGTERKVDGEKTIYVGIKPKRETVTIPHKVLDPKEGFEIVPGKDGSKDVVTTYEVNPETGKVTSSTHEENLVQQVDDKYKPITYTYKGDPNMEPGTERKVDNEKTIYVGTKSTRETVTIPHKVLDPKEGFEIIPGTDGSKDVVTTYEVNPETGKVTSSTHEENLVPQVDDKYKPITYTYKGDPNMEPGTERKVDSEKTIYVGIKPKRETVTIPHKVLDPKEGFEIIPGTDGSKDVVTTYEVNPETGEVTPSTHEENLVPQVDDKYKPITYTYKGDPNIEPGTERKVDSEKTIYVGIKPKRETVVIPHMVLDPKEGFEIIPGTDGSKDVVTTYEVDTSTGKVTPSTHEENLVPQVDDKYKPIVYTYKGDPNIDPGTERKVDGEKTIYVGIKPKRETVVIPHKVLDPKEGFEIILGKDGSKDIVTTYEVNPETGKVTSSTHEENLVPQVDDKYKPIDYTYKGDPNMEPGTERKVDNEKTIYVGTKSTRETVTIPHKVLDPKERFEIIPGTDGSKDVVTTYEVNPETGKVTSSTHEENLVPQVDDKYKPIDYTYKGDPNMEPGTERKVDGEKTIYVGIKPKRETVTIPHKVLDPKEGFEIIPGTDGSKDVVTTYEVDPETGKVISSTHEENLVPQVDDKYKPIVYTYKGDPTMEPGTERKVDGEKTIYVGTKSNTRRELTPHKVLPPKDGFEIVLGKDGYKDFKISYTVDSNTGKITSEVALINEVPAIDDSYKKTGDGYLKLEGKISYRPDPSMEIGTERREGNTIFKGTKEQIRRIVLEKKTLPPKTGFEILIGKNGYKDIVTTYKVNPETGEISSTDMERNVIQPIDDQYRLIPITMPRTGEKVNAHYVFSALGLLPLATLLIRKRERIKKEEI